MAITILTVLLFIFYFGLCAAKGVHAAEQDTAKAVPKAQK